MDLTVLDRTPVATDTVCFTLAAPGGGPLPRFEPGAHLPVSAAGFTRHYSLTSSPHDTGRYRICVLRARPGRGGSAWLHDRLRVGDRLTVAGPFNAFPLRLDAGHSVFIAGGIGITPFIPMIETLARLDRTFDLHYAARSADRFLPLPAPGGRTLHYDDSKGQRLDVPAILQALAPDVDLYVCGPRGLIEAVRAEARARGWPGHRVHFESFGVAPGEGDAPVTVHCARSGLEVEVPAGTTILDALLAAGVWAPYECRRGQCASCVAEVLGGEPDHRDVCLTEEQRRTTMCPCVSRARSREIVLDL